MSFDVVEIVKFIVENYGLAGFVLLFWSWNGWQLQKKIDTLQNSSNKMFGIMLALSDQRSREVAELRNHDYERLAEK